MTGFVNVFKEEGASSAYAVNRLKRLSGSPCGHMGTLDPYASGVLPIAVGNAARLFEYFLGKKKVYVAKFRFGVTSASLDRESELIFGGDIPNSAQIEEVLPQFIGDIEQVPPAFSAVVVGGQRSYKMARQGREVELKAKRVHIDSMKLLGKTAPDEYEFEIVCGGGTYIRSLARDLAAALSTKGYMSALRRTQSGIFTEDASVPLGELTPENLGQYLIPTEEVLPYPVLETEDERYYHGVRIPSDRADGIYKIYRGGVFYGTGIVEDGVLRPGKKLC